MFWSILILNSCVHGRSLTLTENMAGGQPMPSIPRAPATFPTVTWKVLEQGCCG